MINDLPKKVCNRKHRRRIQGKIIWKHEEILHSVKIFYPFWDFSFFSIRFEIAESKRVFFQTYQYQRATRCKRSNFRMRKLEVLIRQMILFFLGPPLKDNQKLIWLPLLLWSLFSLDSNFNGDLFPKMSWQRKQGQMIVFAGFLFKNKETVEHFLYSIAELQGS